MALVLLDRAQETATANTTVSFTMSGAVAGYQSLAGVGNGNTTYYGATDGTNWETGIGTYSTTGPTLTRTTILASSNSNLAVTFSGTVTVFVDYPSGKSVYLDSTGLLTANSFASSSAAITGGSINNTPIGATTPNTIAGTNISSATAPTNTVPALALTGTPNNAAGGKVGVLAVGSNFTAADKNIMATFVQNINDYTQIIVQNPNAGTAASADFVVNNDNTTGAGVFGDFGINSSGFTGTGSFNAANATYLYSNGGDLVLGTQTANIVRFPIGSATAADAGTITSTGLNAFPIGATTASTGAFTTLSASSTVSGTGFSTYLASPPAIGGTTAAAGTFTQLTVNGASVNTSISPTGTGTVTISPAGALTINPTAASTINNTSIGATTAASGRFTNAIITASAGTTAPLQLTAGTNLATAAAGAFEYDGTVPYFSMAASSRGVLPSEQMVVLGTAYTLTSQTAAQKIFNNTTNGAVTLPIGTYQFECFYSLSAMSTNSGSFGFALGVGTAVIGSQGWWAICSKTGGLATPSYSYNTTASTSLTAASTVTTGNALIKGFFRVTTAGTVIPQVSLGVAAAAVVGAQSYFKVSPIANSGTAATNFTIGNWS